MVTSDVARVEGQTRLSTDTGDATEFTRFSSLLVKRDGRWLVAEIREYPAPVEDVSTFDRLKELELYHALSGAFVIILREQNRRSLTASAHASLIGLIGPE